MANRLDGPRPFSGWVFDNPPSAFSAQQSAKAPARLYASYDPLPTEQ
jgi:hypothetical protein